MFLLFDLDGTLTDSNGLWLDVDLEFAHRRNLPVTPEYTNFVKHSIFSTAADFTKDYYHLSESPQQIMDEWLELAHGAYAVCPEKPGAVAFLTACRSQNLPMAVVTASMPPLCKTVLQQLEVYDFFHFFLYAQDLGLEKSDPRVWQEAARLAGCSPSECIVFDDSPRACASARAAGCKDIGIADPLYAEAHAEMQKSCSRFWTSLAGHRPEELFLL